LLSFGDLHLYNDLKVDTQLNLFRILNPETFIFDYIRKTFLIINTVDIYFRIFKECILTLIDNSREDIYCIS
jgi:hypothetical protein